jgi:hypothetical protein
MDFVNSYCSGVFSSLVWKFSSRFTKFSRIASFIPVLLNYFNILLILLTAFVIL